VEDQIISALALSLLSSAKHLSRTLNSLGFAHKGYSTGDFVESVKVLWAAERYGNTAGFLDPTISRGVPATRLAPRLMPSGGIFSVENSSRAAERADDIALPSALSASSVVDPTGTY